METVKFHPSELNTAIEAAFNRACDAAYKMSKIAYPHNYDWALTEASKLCRNLKYNYQDYGQEFRVVGALKHVGLNADKLRHDLDNTPLKEYTPYMKQVKVFWALAKIYVEMTPNG